ncbi:hypothetical protein [Bacillus sp. ISL-45]|uniref:copper resistance D family protein n=1 Tax=Bacillus sp. ISL-45 TaxID=2819128 RepID=UPI001BE66404|nr:hypothetical protein [Bacillus sp. ISL-45]MBT2663185.1 hypothetical protein [Bacillus sp. ISL-45]
MIALTPLSELGSYLVFSILAGHVALQFVPLSKKPAIHIPKKVLLLSCLGIYLFTFGPVAQVISYFSGSVGFTLAVYSVLTDFEVGKAWLFIGLMSVLLWFSLLFNASKYIQAAILLLMILAVGYASHVASLSGWAGFSSHSIHFLAVTLWIGILFHVAWFAKDQSNWSSFLSWFTPFAITSFLIILISGLTLMSYVVKPEDYVSSWAVPYGHTLLLKHISIIPILFFAFLNGLLARKSRFSDYFDPSPWLKIESIMILMAFYFTSILGTLSPPHEVDFTIKTEGAFPWVEWILGINILSTQTLEFIPMLPSILLFIISILFLTLIFISFKKVKPLVALFFGLSFIFAMYFGLLLSLSF